MGDARSHRIAWPSIGCRFLSLARSLDLACLTDGAVAGPAAVQWTRVDQVPIANIYNVWTTGDAVAAGTDIAPGIYLARLRASGRSAAVRLIRTR